MNTDRRAFTLTELVVVVAIILLITGISLAVVNVLMRSKQKTVTLAGMESLTRAVTAYLDSYAVLGHQDDSRDFVADPLGFLVRRPRTLGRDPFIKPSVRHLVRVSAEPSARYRLVGMGSVTVVTTAQADATLDTATHVVGDFNREPLVWRVCNGMLVDKPFPRLIELRSRAGTPDDPVDDLIYVYTAGSDDVAFDGNTYPATNGNWLLMRQYELE